MRHKNKYLESQWHVSLPLQPLWLLQLFSFCQGFQLCSKWFLQSFHSERFMMFAIRKNSPSFLGEKNSIAANSFEKRGIEFEYIVKEKYSHFSNWKFTGLYFSTYILMRGSLFIAILKLFWGYPFMLFHTLFFCSIYS